MWTNKYSEIIVCKRAGTEIACFECLLSKVYRFFVAINGQMSVNVRFKVLERSDFDQAFAFLQNIFRVQEPISDALPISANDSYIFYKDLCSAGFQTLGTSVGILSQNNELVGIALNAVYNYNELPKILATQKSDFTRGKSQGKYFKIKT